MSSQGSKPVTEWAVTVSLDSRRRSSTAQALPLIGATISMSSLYYKQKATEVPPNCDRLAELSLTKSSERE